MAYICQMFAFSKVYLAILQLTKYCKIILQSHCKIILQFCNIALFSCKIATWKVQVIFILQNCKIRITRKNYLAKEDTNYTKILSCNFATYETRGEFYLAILLQTRVLLAILVMVSFILQFCIEKRGIFILQNCKI